MRHEARLDGVPLGEVWDHRDTAEAFAEGFRSGAVYWKGPHVLPETINTGKPSRGQALPTIREVTAAEQAGKALAERRATIAENFDELAARIEPQRGREWWSVVRYAERMPESAHYNGPAQVPFLGQEPGSSRWLEAAEDWIDAVRMDLDLAEVNRGRVFPRETTRVILRDGSTVEHVRESFTVSFVDQLGNIGDSVFSPREAATIAAMAPECSSASFRAMISGLVGVVRHGRLSREQLLAAIARSEDHEREHADAIAQSDEQKKIQCPFCGGSGYGASADGDCNACLGAGRLTTERVQQHEQHVRDLEYRRSKGRRRGRR